MKEVSYITTVASFEKLCLDKEALEIIAEGEAVLYCMNPMQFFFLLLHFLVHKAI